MQKRTKYLIAAALAAIIGTATLASVSYVCRYGDGSG